MMSQGECLRDSSIGQGQQRCDGQINQRGALPADIASERPWCSELRHKCEVNEDDPDERKTVVSFCVDQIEAIGTSLTL